MEFAKQGAAEVVGLELAPTAASTAGEYVAEQLKGGGQVGPNDAVAALPLRTGKSAAYFAASSPFARSDHIPLVLATCLQTIRAYRRARPRSLKVTS